MIYLIAGLSLLGIGVSSFAVALYSGDWRLMLIAALCGFLVAGTLRG